MRPSVTATVATFTIAVSALPKGTDGQPFWLNNCSSSHPLLTALFGPIPVGAQKAWLESRERVYASCSRRNSADLGGPCVNPAS
jgi:hypothetical protein